MKKICRMFFFFFILVIIFLFTKSGVDAEELTYTHTNHQGSTSFSTDGNGYVVSKRSYYPYGQTISDEGDQNTEKGYTSQISDINQTNLYYYNARYYNPLIAKFTQSDTVLSRNRYSYVGNNPIVFSDPSGRIREYQQPKPCIEGYDCQDDLSDYREPSGERVDFWLEVMLKKYSVSINDIPTEIRLGNPSMLPDFGSIPEMVSLRSQLKNANYRDKWIYISKILGLLGVNTNEEITGWYTNDSGLAFNPEYQTERWSFDGDSVPLCNTYSTTVMNALGIWDISHWFGNDGSPQINTGDEYLASEMREWLEEYGQDYGWIDLNGYSIEERLEMLANGYVFYGATGGHTFVIFGVYYGDGQVIPVQTQASYNNLFKRPYYMNQIDMDTWNESYNLYFGDELEISGPLWAHLLPHIESEN